MRDHQNTKFPTLYLNSQCIVDGINEAKAELKPELFEGFDLILTDDGAKIKTSQKDEKKTGEPKSETSSSGSKTTTFLDLDESGELDAGEYFQNHNEKI